MKNIKNNCVGYFYTWTGDFLATIGSEYDKMLIPLHLIADLRPVSSFEALIRGVPSYWELDKTSLNERQLKKRDKRDKQYQNKIVIYHVPLNHKKLVEIWKKFDKLYKELSSNMKPYQPYFKSIEEYSNALKERFQEPYFIHHRKTEPRPALEWFIVGEKQYTSDLIIAVAEKPNLVKETIKEIFMEEGKNWLDATLRRAYSTQDTLLFYDSTKNPKKQEIKIEW